MHLFELDTLLRTTHRLAMCFFFLFSFTVATCFGLMIQDKNAESDSRSIGEYRQDLKSFMKLSKEDDPQFERNAIYNLCQLHFEITTDSRFTSSQQLQGMRAVIAKRLETFSKDEKNLRLRKQRQAKKSKARSAPSGRSTRNDSNPVAPRIRDSEARSEPGGFGRGETSESSVVSTGATSDSAATEAMLDSAYESYYSIGTLSGGPSQLFGYAGGQMGPPWDHGEELVDLITSVINPSFWRRNGGVGSIHYYQPLRIIVVRASQQGNEEVGDLLERLRANGDVQLNLGGVGGAIGN